MKPFFTKPTYFDMPPIETLQVLVDMYGLDITAEKRQITITFPVDISPVEVAKIVMELKPCRVEYVTSYIVNFLYWKLED